MCDCDCELPKRERWRQIREQALHEAGRVAVPNTGAWFVTEGKVFPLPEIPTHTTGGAAEDARQAGE
jgi:hypothetical protein